MIAILTVGIPGAGKSTFADSLPNTYVKIELDELRAKVSGNAANQKATPKALKLREKMINEAAAAGKNIVISDTNINETHRENLITTLESLGYDVRLKILDIDINVCKERNSQRANPVPEEVIDRMYKELQEQYWLWV